MCLYAQHVGITAKSPGQDHYHSLMILLHTETVKNIIISNYSINTSHHLDASQAQCSLKILRHSERNTFRHTQTPSLLKAHVVVYVHHLSHNTQSSIITPVHIYNHHTCVTCIL